MAEWIRKLVEEHQFFRRLSLTLTWAVILFDNYQIFRDGGFIDRGLINGPTATIFGSVTGLLGAVITWAYYKNRSVSQSFDYSERREFRD